MPHKVVLATGESLSQDECDARFECGPPAGTRMKLAYKLPRESLEDRAARILGLYLDAFFRAPILEPINIKSRKLT